MRLVSVIIPARNEASTIGKCFTALRKAAARAECTLQIIVVINRCTDDTEAVARAAGCEIVKEDAKNLSKIRNAGVKAARGDIVVTVDADSIVSENIFSKMLLAMKNPRAVGGGVLILPERWSLGIFVTGIYLLPIALWYGISGGLFFMNKVDFDAIGGFDESLVSVEDIDFAKRLKAYAKQNGRRFVNLFSAHIVTSCRKFDRFGDWYFALRPQLIWKLLKGRNQSEADKMWYDFEREA